MRSILLKSLLVTMILCFPTPSVRGHVPTNIVVDNQGSVYFLDVFNNSLMKVTQRGTSSELVSLFELNTWDRPHGLAIDKDPPPPACRSSFVSGPDLGSWRAGRPGVPRR